MKWFLLWLLGGTGLVIVAFCLLVLLLRGRIRRRHRVDPKVATGAPLTWLADPRAPARLHRRLARIGSTIDAVAADHQPRRRLGRRVEPGPLLVAAEDLRARAVHLDRQLATVARLAPAARKAPLADLDRLVTELEHDATRLAALSAQSLTPRALAPHLDPHPEGQLERLAEAQRELDALDHAAGLRPAHPTVLDPPPPPPPPAPQHAGQHVDATSVNTRMDGASTPTRPVPATDVGGTAGR